LPAWMKKAVRRKAQVASRKNIPPNFVPLAKKYRKRKMSRPTWEEYFMDITRLVSKRATCLRRQVGAVLVMDKRILATGYNGAPSGLAHCLEIGCLRELKQIPSGERHELCRGLHGEQNAIIQASLYGISVKDSVIYITNQPCIICAKMLINAGVSEIVISGGYPDKMSAQMLKEAKIKIRRII